MEWIETSRRLDEMRGRRAEEASSEIPQAARKRRPA
jgi:hypothetical protein